MTLQALLLLQDIEQVGGRVRDRVQVVVRDKVLV